MSTITDDDIRVIRLCSALQFQGGSMPYYYGDYLRREKLRRRGLLRFWRRRSSRWDWNCYDITERGQALLQSWHARSQTPIR